LERIRDYERKRRMESNEGHVQGSMGSVWSDAKDVIEKTDSLLTKADPLADDAREIIDWLMGFLRWFGFRSKRTK
jgi:hypothetical protein